jgi:two-component system LytT family response regulator
MTCLAIDDEPLALKQLAAYIKKVPFLELEGECQSAVQAKKILDDHSVDLIFVDINMPDLNGMDFVKSLTDRPMVVFTTAYADYAIEGYKVDAVDYLLKPFTAEDLLRSAEKARSHYELKRAAVLTPTKADDALFVKTEHRVVRIDISKIVYVEGMSEYLRIYIEGEQKPLIVLLSMKKLEERLSGNMFMRIHKSYFINLSKIQEVNKNRVVMSGDVYLPIGDIYRQAFTSYIENRFLNQ